MGAVVSLMAFGAAGCLAANVRPLPVIVRVERRDMLRVVTLSLLPSQPAAMCSGLKPVLRPLLACRAKAWSRAAARACLVLLSDAAH